MEIQTMQEIKLNLTIENLNLLLEGLGNLPYARVYQLVAMIQQQASEQIQAAEKFRSESEQTISDQDAIPVAKRAAFVGK
jgi:hypothetical protein